MSATVTTRIEGGFDTVTVNAIAPAHTRISYQSAGYCNVALATEVGDGIMDRPTLAVGETDVRVHLTNAPGSKFGIASGAVTVGATLYAAANGQVSATQAANAPVVGKALTAAADQGILTYYSRTVI